MDDHPTRNDAGQPPCSRCGVLYPPTQIEHVPLYEPEPDGAYWHAPRFVWLCEACHDGLRERARPRAFITCQLWDALPPIDAARGP